MTLFKNKYRIESARLDGWDYRNPGYYFVTICTRGREPFFGSVVGEDVALSAIGEIAAQCWLEIPRHHNGVVLDEWTVMPNHKHGIIALTTPVEMLPSVETLHRNVSTRPSGKQMSAISPKTGSLSVIIRSYKSAVSYLTRQAGLSFGWQGRFWDHVIRNEAELNRIREYIRANPSNWDHDRNNEDGLWM